MPQKKLKQKRIGKLTVKQEAFCKAYVETGNASEAYRTAYSTQNMKQETIAVKACELLKTGNVSVRVEQLRVKVSEKLEKEFDITQDRVLSELAAMAFYDPAQLVLQNGAGKVQEISGPADIAKLPENIRRCIVGWSYDRHGHFILKLANKTSSLELIGRHLAMFVDRKEIRVGELEQVSDEELDRKMAEAAQQIAQAENVPVEMVVKQIRQKMTGERTVH